MTESTKASEETQVKGGTVLYGFSRWSDKPSVYTVQKRTPKLIVVQEVGDRTRWHRSIADVGVSLFLTELEAWEAHATRCRENVERDKSRLQHSRTQLGMAESEVKRLKAEGEARHG